MRTAFVALAVACAVGALITKDERARYVLFLIAIGIPLGFMAIRAAGGAAAALASKEGPKLLGK